MISMRYTQVYLTITRTEIAIKQFSLVVMARNDKKEEAR